MQGSLNIEAEGIKLTDVITPMKVSKKIHRKDRYWGAGGVDRGGEGNA